MVQPPVNWLSYQSHSSLSWRIERLSPSSELHSFTAPLAERESSKNHLTDTYCSIVNSMCFSKQSNVTDQHHRQQRCCGTTENTFLEIMPRLPGCVPAHEMPPRPVAHTPFLKRNDSFTRAPPVHDQHELAVHDWHGLEYSWPALNIVHLVRRKSSELTVACSLHTLSLHPYPYPYPYPSGAHRS